MKYFCRLTLALAASATLVLSGCASQPAPPQAVRIRWAHDPEGISPLALFSQEAVDVVNLAYCSLLQIDVSCGAFAPLLVEALPTVQPIGDSLTLLSYRLRPQARWDDGQPVLARDVDFTLKLMFCPGLPNEGPRMQYSFITGIKVDPADPRRFTLVCRGQSPEYAQASGDFPILSEAALDPGGRLRGTSLAALQALAPGTAPDSVLATLARRYQALASGPSPAGLPGCGPYQLTHWEKGRLLRFRRKADWWGQQLRPTPFVMQAKPELLEYVIIPDDATASLALQRGDVDVYPQVPAREFNRLRLSALGREKLSFYTAASHEVVIAGFNTRRPALADPATRQALSRLFDAQGLLQATQLGEGRRTVGMVNPTDRAHYNDSLQLLPFDPAGAADRLRQAGWRQSGGPAGPWQRRVAGAPLQRLSLTVRYRADEANFETVALQFRTAAARLGIPVTLQPTESSLLPPALRAGDFDLFVRTLKGNPFIFNYAPILHSEAVGESNHTGYGTPASDRLIEAVAKADTPARRAQLLRRFQARLQADAPLVPLFFLPMRLAAARSLTNLHVSGIKPGYSAAAMDRRAAESPAQ